jgi:Ser/Thr protein kinase RdoA (MazF antagonist)
MQPPTQLTVLCRRWSPATPVSVAVLGAAGFSGSQVFVVQLPDRPGRFVLKSFHAGASVEHARFVHGLVRHLRAEGVVEVPEVIPTVDGDTVVVAADGTLWELCRFMTGVAVPCPAAAQSAAAATMLARLHLAAAGLPDHPPRARMSPGVERRIEQARRLLAEPWQARHVGWFQDNASLLSAEFRAALDARVAKAIAIFDACGGTRLLSRWATFRPDPCVLQPVLRDIWCDHVFFDDERSDAVTAIIDLHAAGIDTPATDLARLVGSWSASAANGPRSLLDRWPEAIAAYERVRPLSREEAGLIPCLHGTGVLFGLDNWFRWTLEEHREFSDSSRVLARIDSLLEALPGGLAAAWSAGGFDD